MVSMYGTKTIQLSYDLAPAISLMETSAGFLSKLGEMAKDAWAREGMTADGKGES